MTDRTTAVPASRYFDYLPVGLFGSVMGLTGLSLVWRAAHARYGAPACIAEVLAVIAVAAFVALAVAYGLKLATAADAARAELQHPIAVNMFATFWISLLLLPLVLAPFNLLLARVLWGIGAAGLSILAWYIVSRWMTKQHEHPQAAPAWMLPVVGLLDLPLAVPSLGLAQWHGLMVVGLAVGLFFAIPLFTMIFSRLIFEPPLPPPLQPTLLILVAPTAVGMSTYVATTGEVDLFAKSLYAVTLFLLAVLLGRLRHLPSCCPFRVGWWAVSFPLAACAIAALRFVEAGPGWATEAIALVLVLLATVVILGLLIRTLLGIARGELRALST
jgi:tellurite resistance protein